MEHMLLKAATTATDQGIFEAVISAATIDREKDIIEPAAMVTALQRWTPTGKKIPLAWNHSTAASYQIGYIDPGSSRAVGNEVAVSGWIDQSTPVGADAWRQVKMGTLGFSFGYLVPEGGATPRKGGGNHITELDVFEVTATPTPMNNDTRVLGYKADVKSLEQELQETQAELAQTRKQLEDLQKKADEISETTRPRQIDPLKAKADALVLEVMSNGESLRKPPKPSEPTPRVSLADVRRQMHQATLDALIGGLDL